jgi:CDGSH-type Zn-finger protein
MSGQPPRRQNSPWILDLDAGKYAWCQCGRSAKDPFCDGSHVGTDCAPRIFVLEEAQRVALCGCKMTQTGDPFCDGSHTKL